MRDRLEELQAQAGDDDDTDYLSLLPRALEWQRWLLIHALELLEGSDAFRFRTVLLLVARQNGKSTILTALILWRLFQDGARLVLETHASLDHAKKAWAEAVAIAEAIPELDEDIAKTNGGKGSELLELVGKEKFKIATANRRGGRGFSGDLIVFDELREQQDWASWSATSKTTMARRRAQVWGVSSAGDLSAVVLRHLRKVAIGVTTGEALEGIPEELHDSLDLDTIGLFEWSAGTVDGTPGGQQRGIWDRDGWAEANPSMGLSELDERAIATAALGDPEWEFRTEVLCQFFDTLGSGPFPNGSWAETLDLKSERIDRRVERDLSRPATYGIDVSHDRGWAFVAVAFWDTEGRMRFELAAQGGGTDWLIPWLQSPKRLIAPRHVTFQWRGAPVSSLKKDFENAGITVVPWEGDLLGGWHGVFYDKVRKSVDEVDPEILITHGFQPLVDVAAGSAVIKILSNTWVIDRGGSPQDPSPLIACIGAVGLLNTNPEPEFRSAYEERGLLVV